MSLEEVLKKNRNKIIKQWVYLLQTKVSQRYSERPNKEFFTLVPQCTDAFYAVLVNHDFLKMNDFIEKLAQIRFSSGFSLSEVQKAFELYRTMLLPILIKEIKSDELLYILRQINDSLEHSIIKFSDYFQSLKEKQIRDYAQNLEREVEKRTKELAESETKYRILVEEMNDGYFVNQKGIIVFANLAFCDMHGYTLTEVLGRPYLDFVAPESQTEVQKLYETRIIRGEARDLYIYFRLHKNGSIFPTENKVKIIFYQGEYAAAGICRDITQRMEMERCIRESERLAHIGQLTTSLAHEIRNPLSSVKMNIQILLKKIEFEGNDKRRMEIMAHEISRLERILEKMLDFARPLKLNMEPVSINGIIDSCLEIMDAKIKGKGIYVKKTLSKKIPYTLMDRDKIEQTIINILLNPIEILPNGGKIEIITKLELRNGKLIKVEISDNGPGISSEDLPYIFDPFFSKRKKGTGLGLSNVKKIIEAHGGTVTTTAKKPHGMILGISIPAVEIT